MTRFLDTEDWQPDADPDRHRAAAPLPAFLREEPLDRPEVTDLTLHFHHVGPSFRAAARPADPVPDSTQEIALEAPAPAATASSAPSAQAASAEPAAQGRPWTPSLAYSSFFAAQPHSYEIAPDSYLAEAQPLPVSSSFTPEDIAAAERAGREWDPLVDPWPTEGTDGIEASLVAHAARERGLTVVPDLVDDRDSYVTGYDHLRDPLTDQLSDDLSDDAATMVPAAAVLDDEVDEERSPFQSVAYQPVVFSPAPYVPPVPQVVAKAEAEDTALMTQPFDLSLQHPSGPLPRTGVWPPPPVVPATPAELTAPPTPADEVSASLYDVSLTGPLGTIDLGFVGGHWYSLAGDDEARPVTTGEAVRSHPELAGQIVQVVSWWMRENPKTDRALDLATELAMAVSEVLREKTNALR